MQKEQINLIKAAFPNWPKSQDALLRPRNLELLEQIIKFHAVTLNYGWESSDLVTKDKLKIYLDRTKSRDLITRLKFALCAPEGSGFSYAQGMQQITLTKTDDCKSFADLIKATLGYTVESRWVDWLVTSDFNQAALTKKIKEIQDQLEQEIKGKYETYYLITMESKSA